MSRNRRRGGGENPYEDFGSYRLPHTLRHMPPFDWPSAIELATTNPLYYLYYYQFQGGELLRSILGREAVWDAEWDKRFCAYLGRVYESLEKHDLYWIRPFRAKYDFAFAGRERIEGTDKLNSQIHFHSVHRGDNVYIRLNDLPEKGYCEFEFYDHKDKRYKVVKLSSHLYREHLCKRFRGLKKDIFYDIRPRFRRLKFYRGPLRDGDPLPEPPGHSAEDH